MSTLVNIFVFVLSAISQICSLHITNCALQNKQFLKIKICSTFLPTTQTNQNVQGFRYVPWFAVEI